MVTLRFPANFAQGSECQNNGEHRDGMIFAVYVTLLSVNVNFDSLYDLVSPFGALGE